VETVKSFRGICENLVLDLNVIYDILESIHLDAFKQAKEYQLDAVLKKLYSITSSTNVLFEMLQSGKTKVWIKKLFKSTSIREQLLGLKAEIPLVISMLNLVFNIQQVVCQKTIALEVILTLFFSSFQSQGCRGFELGLPKIDESVFDRQEDGLTGEDYADVDDDQ
jgi:hypothetical protein